MRYKSSFYVASTLFAVALGMTTPAAAVGGYLAGQACATGAVGDTTKLGQTQLDATNANIIACLYVDNNPADGMVWKNETQATPQLANAKELFYLQQSFSGHMSINNTIAAANVIYAGWGETGSIGYTTSHCLLSSDNDPNITNIMQDPGCLIPLCLGSFGLPPPVTSMTIGSCGADEGCNPLKSGINCIYSSK